MALEPFTSTGGSLIDQLSQGLSGAANGQANQQLAFGNLGTQSAAAQGTLADRLYQDALNRQMLMNMLPAQYASTGAGMAARGDALANVQDAQVTPPAGIASFMPQISGGLRPSMFGPNARQAGANLSQAGLNLQSTQPNLPAVPTMPKFPNTSPSGLTQGLSGAGFGTGILGLILQHLNQGNGIAPWQGSMPLDDSGEGVDLAP